MPPDTHAPSLKLEHIGLTLGGNKILIDVDLSFEPGLTALIGPNGAGKTSCLNVVSGYARPHSGRVLLNGQDVVGLRPLAVTRLGLARTFQSPHILSGLSVVENAMLGAHAQFHRGHLREIVATRGSRAEARTLRARAVELLDLFGIAGLGDTPAGSLPIGTQKVLEVARALLSSPQILMLDEPAAGLGAEDVQQLVRGLNDYAFEHGTVVVLIEHDVALIRQLCSRVAALNFGHIIAHGPTDEVMSDPQVIEAYVGVQDAS